MFASIVAEVDWHFLRAPETWVAVCTAGLAAATVGLAFSTRRMANVASQEIAVQIKPLVVDGPQGITARTEKPDAARVLVHVRGVGKGPALLLTRQCVAIGGFQADQLTYSGHIEPGDTLIETGEATWITAAFPTTESMATAVLEERLVRIRLELHYTDLSGQQPTKSVLDVVRSHDRTWGVSVVTLTNQGEQEPFATLIRS